LALLKRCGVSVHLTGQTSATSLLNFHHGTLIYYLSAWWVYLVGRLRITSGTLLDGAMVSLASWNVGQKPLMPFSPIFLLHPPYTQNFDNPADRRLVGNLSPNKTRQMRADTPAFAQKSRHLHSIAWSDRRRANYISEMIAFNSQRQFGRAAHRAGLMRPSSYIVEPNLRARRGHTDMVLGIGTF
jgi:hypothetical protein